MLEIRQLKIQQAQQTLLYIDHLQVEAGAVLTVMGASGSGKSTLLRWLLGEPLPDFEIGGQLWLNGERRDQWPIHARKIGLLHQQGDLFPHLRVIDNLLFALPRKDMKREQRAKEALVAMQLGDKAEAWPHQLSGGEQARVALMRALLAKPQALLLDEPFSALDSQLKGTIRNWVFGQLQQSNIPVVMVTHDADDAPSNIVTMAECLHD